MWRPPEEINLIFSKFGTLVGIGICGLNQQLPNGNYQLNYFPNNTQFLQQIKYRYDIHQHLQNQLFLAYLFLRCLDFWIWSSVVFIKPTCPNVFRPSNKLHLTMTLHVVYSPAEIFQYFLNYLQV